MKNTTTAATLTTATANEGLECDVLDLVYHIEGVLEKIKDKNVIDALRGSLIALLLYADDFYCEELGDSRI